MRGRLAIPVTASRIVALATLGSALLAAPAAAYSELDITGSGAVHVAFAGDPSRGCGARGLCGYSGTIDTELSGTEGSGGSDYSDNDTFDQARVRVIRDDASGAGACQDELMTGAGLQIDQVRSQLRLSIDDATSGDAAFYGPALGAGVCAGPRAIHLPSPGIRTVTLSQARRGIDVSLTGSGPIADGAFSGTATVDLNVRLHIVPANFPAGLSAIPPPTMPGGREVDLTLRFDASAPATTLPFTFSGVAPPFCVAVDACGLSGTLTFTTGALAGPFSIEATGAWPRHRSTSLASVLAAFRRGSLQFFVDSELQANAETTESAERNGVPACTDSTSSAFGGLYANQSGTTLQFQLGTDNGGPSSLDPLRTRCPGPGADFSGGFEDNAMLTASTPASTLLSGHDLTLPFEPADGIAGTGYSPLVAPSQLTLTLKPAGRPQVEFSG